jgi:hypothetical protein
VNARHAAALALVGWYLIIPPWNGANRQTNQPAPEAPLSNWQIMRSYADAKSCERERSKWAAGEGHWIEYSESGTAKNTEQVPNAEVQHSLRTLGTYAQCIETDDPRLKSK